MMVASLVCIILCLMQSAFICNASATNAIRGIDPAWAAIYKPSTGQFTCRDGSKIIPLSQVNDNYCDCYDGSDEPGTAACANGKFYCANIGYEPLVLNSSFVDDGICDCCDGTDEPRGICQNTCKLLGTQVLQQLKNDLSHAENGLKIRNKYIKEATQARVVWASRISALQNLQNVADAHSQKATTMKETIEKQFDSLAKKVDALELIVNPSAPPSAAADDATPAQNEEDNDGVEEESTIDASVLEDELNAGDINTEQEDIPAMDSEEESPEEESSEEESPEELAKRVASQWIPGSNKENKGDGTDPLNVEKEEEVEVEQPQASSSPSSDDDTSISADTDDDSKHLEDINLGLVGTFVPFAARFLAGVTGKSGPAAELVRARMELSILRQKRDAARSAAQSLSSTLENLRSEYSVLQRKSSLTYGPQDAYRALDDNCYEASIEKYIYRICPFVDANQVDGHQKTLLGSWEGFDESAQHMKFTNGESCWQGPNRSMTVKLICGEKEELSRVAEPSRCEYTAELMTAAACSEEYVARLDRDVKRKKELLDSINKDEL